MLCLLDETKTVDSMRRHPECVVTCPHRKMWQQVEKLAPLTGKNPVPELKEKQFHFEPEKFDAAGLAACEPSSEARTSERMSRVSRGSSARDA